MIEAICRAFIWLFEVLVCAFFFENYYYRKYSKFVCFIAYAVSFSILYGMSFTTIPLINLISFIICNFVIALICYDTKVKTTIFTTIMLTLSMFVTEMIIVYFSSALFKTAIDAYVDNLFVLITQSSLSKLFFFVVVFFISKFFGNKEHNKTENKFTLMLGVLPISSIIIFYFLTYFGINYNVEYPYNAALTVCAILLLFSNLFVFYIYEKVQKTNIENTQLKLEKQRGEISGEYYEILSEQINESRIINHDIKNHLNHISDIADEGDIKGIKDYINSIYTDFGFNTKIQYSNNKLIDVIINRYKIKCEQMRLDLEVEACGSELELISDNDTVALLDNLFENAIESAVKTEEKKIMFSIFRQTNDYTVSDYVVLEMANSCNNPPKAQNGQLLTLKKDKFSHGVGTKSIKRIVGKYSGTYDWEYDEEHKLFKTKLVMKVK